MLTKKWKKSVSIIAVACMLVVSLTACGGNNSPAPAAPPEDTPAASEEKPATETPASDDQEFNVKIAHPHPAGSATDKGWIKFTELLEEYSGGTIKSEIFPAGSLVSTAEAVEALRNRTVDFAQLSSGDLGTLIPAMNIIEVPGTFKQHGTEYVAGVAPAMRELMSPYGIFYIYAQPGTPSWFFSNKKQIITPEDMQGLTVRASGKYGGQAIEAWGGSPVTITLADLTTAMERNTVDVVITPGLGAYSNGWYELMHYITVTEVTTLMAMMAMSQGLYDEMSPAQQEAVDKAGYEAAIFMYEMTMADVETGNQVMAEYGNSIEVLTDEQNNAFFELAEPLRQSLIAEIGPEAEQLDQAFVDFR